MTGIRGFVAATILLSCAFAGAVSAQDPVEVTPDGNFSLGLGEIKVFRFQQTVGSVNVIRKGVVEALAESDRQISVHATGLGITQVYIFDPNGQKLYSASFSVNPEAGRQVKIYGTTKRGDPNAGYVSVWCNARGCGRSDKDLPAPEITIRRIISEGPTFRGE